MSKSFRDKARPPGRKPSAAEIAAFEVGAAPAVAPARPAPAKPAAAEGPTTRISVDLPEAMHFAFKLACMKRKTKMAKVLMEGIEAYIADVERGGK